MRGESRGAVESLEYGTTARDGVLTCKASRHVSLVTVHHAQVAEALQVEGRIRRSDLSRDSSQEGGDFRRRLQVEGHHER